MQICTTLLTFLSIAGKSYEVNEPLLRAQMNLCLPPFSLRSFMMPCSMPGNTCIVCKQCKGSDFIASCQLVVCHGYAELS